MDDYLALLISIVLSAILFFILVISLIAEFIEKSKVPRKYYQIMTVSIIVPILVTVIFYFINGGISWL